MNDIQSGVFGPPTCNRCHRQLARRESCGFFDAIEVTIERITNPFYTTQYACKGKVYNQKYELWKDDCKKIDEKNKKIRLQNRITGLFGKQKPEIPYPPRPPKRIACPNHYCQMPWGKYDERVVRKRRRVFYDNAGRIYYR